MINAFAFGDMFLHDLSLLQWFISSLNVSIEKNLQKMHY